jgi:hypothetical protein
MTDPLWARTSSATDYGGHPNKRDYGETGCVNALTDVSAEQIKRMAADLAAVARTIASWRGVLSRSGTTITVSGSRPLWADTVVPYDGSAAPTGHPSAALTDTDEVTLTFPATATDEYGNEAAISVLACFPLNTATTWDGTTGSNAVVLNSFADSSSVAVEVW